MVGAANDALYTLDVSTGRATVVRASNVNAFAGRVADREFNPSGLASHGGNLYMVGKTGIRLYRLDTTTGLATPIANFTGFGVGENAPEGLASHGGTLYMVGAANDALYTLDVSTGRATRVGSASQFGVSENFPRGLASLPA